SSILVGIGSSAAAMNNTASLTISNGGTVTVDALPSPSIAAGLTVGSSNGASLTVTGDQSTLQMAPVSGFMTGREMLIGGFGTGSVLVTDNGRIDAAGIGINVSGGAD